MYVDPTTLRAAVSSLHDAAGYMLRIWLTLKHMGLTEHRGVTINTQNSTDSLACLFSNGSPEGTFFVPFAGTPRFKTMKSDASRSIVQTTVRRWATSGSVVGCDPTSFLEFTDLEGQRIHVRTGQRYPFGLGHGQSGFAQRDDMRVALPLTAFAVWYGRQVEIPDDQDPQEFLESMMLVDLNISTVERELIFDERNPLDIGTQTTAISDEELFDICVSEDVENDRPLMDAFIEPSGDYRKRIRTMMTNLDQPLWLRTPPRDDVVALLEAGAKSILLYGPPRTGKTRLIDSIAPREDGSRTTIQIHDGWGYDHLIESLRPVGTDWVWCDGPLKEAIDAPARYIVLEEINRTLISQALGETFLLLEGAYRGAEHTVTLRSGRPFGISPDTIFFMTMNTVDKSTEDVDDALLGRVAAVEVPPSAEAFAEILRETEVAEELTQKLRVLFVDILDHYPLGHGYFAGLGHEPTEAGIIAHYKARIRPVLQSHFGTLRATELQVIDSRVDELFRP